MDHVCKRCKSGKLAGAGKMDEPGAFEGTTAEDEYYLPRQLSKRYMRRG